MNDPLPELTDLDRSIYEWQMWMPGVGEEGQRRLKGATVLISRVGGLGSVVAMELAAAGVGHLVLAHAGNLKPADMNRQLLQTRDHIGKPRIDSIVSRLKDLNPDVRITPVAENLSAGNAENLIKGVDLVVDAAPLFEERLAMNDAAFRQGKPLVECAMHGMAASLTTFQPGQTGCLRCQVPEVPPITAWKRQFPVFGAVSGTVACLGAMEAIKWITGLGTLLSGELLSMDLGSMRFRKLKLPRNPDCPICSGVARIPHP